MNSNLNTQILEQFKKKQNNIANFLTIVNDHTRCTGIYLLKFKFKFKVQYIIANFYTMI